MREGRAEALRVLVAELGIGSDAAVAGAQHDIAVIHGVLPAAITPVADRIRDLGFRHVTIDLASIPADGRG